MTGSIYDWAVAPDNNQTADAAINWQEFQDPATVNNSARQMMARVSEWLKDVVPSRTSTGAVASTYNVSSNSIPSTGTIPDGFIISFIAHQTNTAAATLYLNAFGGAPLRGATGVALTAGQIQNKQPVTAIYKASTAEWLTTNSGAQLSGYLTGLQSSDLTARIIKTGMIMAWPTATIPAGWLECNGSAVSRTGYPELFLAYGTTYGAGDGSTTFAIPDYRGRFLRGWSHASGLDPDSAARTTRGDGTTGDNVGTKQASTYQSHSHTYSGTTSGSISGSITGTITGTAASAGGHSHTYGGAVVVDLGSASTVSTYGGTSFGNTAAVGTHTHSVSGSCTGTCAGSCTGTCSGTSDLNGGSTETRPLNINVVWCCLALPSAAAAGALGTNGLQYVYSTSTVDGDPGNGVLRFDNTSPALATKIYISKTDAVNSLQTVNLTGIFGSASSTKGTVLINQVGAQGNAFSCLVTAIDTSPANYIRLTVSNVSAGTFTSGATLGVLTSRTGDPGSQGSKGTLAVANGLNSNLVPPANSSLRLTGPTAAFSAGGFTGGVDGQQLRLYNTVAQTMTLVNEDAGSTAANRIKTLTGSNIVLRASATSFATLEYDGTDARWIVVNTN